MSRVDAPAAAELAHRIKDTLALVLAPAEQARRAVASPGAFHAVSRDRLAALARSHDALRRGGETGRRRRRSTRRCACLPGRRWRSGWRLRPPRPSTASFGARLAGAAAPGRGRGGRGGHAWHEVLWEDSGGPQVAGRPAQRGFGAGLLERGLAARIGGAVALDSAPSGLRCRIRLPAEGGLGAAGRTGAAGFNATGTGPAGTDAA